MYFRSTFLLRQSVEIKQCYGFHHVLPCSYTGGRSHDNTITKLGTFVDKKQIKQDLARPKLGADWGNNFGYDIPKDFEYIFTEKTIKKSDMSGTTIFYKEIDESTGGKKKYKKNRKTARRRRKTGGGGLFSSSCQDERSLTKVKNVYKEK